MYIYHMYYPLDSDTFDLRLIYVELNTIGVRNPYPYRTWNSTKVLTHINS